MSVAFIAVGSNVAPRENVLAALSVLRQRVAVRGSSTFYQTQPVGGRDQPAFINGVWRIASALRPAQIRDDVLAPIEDRLGRVRTTDKYADRTIDLDLVLYDDFAIDEEGLVLPHPDICRPFVAGPIIELLRTAENEIEADLLTAIGTLLPNAEAMDPPGEPLHDLTAQLREMIA